MRESGTRSGLRSNVLFVLNVFIVFLLLFESGLVIPVWLQPFGRMHAMILHFPIVVLLIALTLEFFHTRVSRDARRFYGDLTRDFLFAGVILSAITVIMGIFLAREDAYDQQILWWHKWSGSAVFFLSSFIYMCRDLSWFRVSYAKAGAIATAVTLLVAGHFGGAITHGENFIWKPVLPVAGNQRVPIEEARAFDDVLKPILQSKCGSCHNAEKQKGKLLLTDSTSVLKGGKSGKLFVAGDPEGSLMFKRLRLPIDEKKHMPPSGKPQLTNEELGLLYQWIKSGANFSAKVYALPETDSFRLTAIRIMESRDRGQERYDFPAVEVQTLEKLNSNYRVIRPVSKNSPALTVNIYNRAEYSPRTLDDLKEVRQQVISLDLSKMPVTNEHLKYVGRFENLRKLNLNFTGITGAGLSFLYPLKHLEALSLSGTSINHEDLLKLLPQLPGIKAIAIWETALTPAEVSSLQNTFVDVSIVGISDEKISLIKLNPPRLVNKPRVFEDSISLHLFHPVNGVNIHFTTDGSDPDSVTAPLFKNNTRLTKTVSVRARAFKKGWLSSEPTTMYVYRSAHKPDTAILLSRLNRVHPANGAQTFFDHELGTFNANSPAWANNWAGFIRNDMDLLVKYDSPKRISSVSLNTLIEPETSIFPPETIEVWGGSSPDNLRLITTKRIMLPTDYKKPYIQLFDCMFAEQQVSCLKIVAKPVMKLPAWHKNKNKPALLLIDEILIN